MYHYSFLLPSHSPGYDCINLFIHLPADGHLGYFQLLAVVNKGVSYKYLFTCICENMFLLLLGKYLGEEYLGHMIGRGLHV